MDMWDRTRVSDGQSVCGIRQVNRLRVHGHYLRDRRAGLGRGGHDAAPVRPLLLPVPRPGKPTSIALRMKPARRPGLDGADRAAIAQSRTQNQARVRHSWEHQF